MAALLALFRALGVDPAERFFDKGVEATRPSRSPPAAVISSSLPPPPSPQLKFPEAGILSEPSKSRFSVSTVGSADGNDDDSSGRTRTAWSASSTGAGSGSRSDGAAEPGYLLSRRRKWLVVALVAYAGATCSVATSIYYPALEVVSTQVSGVGFDQVNLSITTFLAAQAVMPIIWAPMVDRLGRRPIYMASLLLCTAANVELGFAPNLTFNLLMALRALQAAGTAAVISLGNCVVQDVAFPEERDTFVGFYQVVQSFGVVIAPVIGGLLMAAFDFRAIFIFLLIGSATSLVVLIVLLPETSGDVAGYKSFRQSGIHRPPAQFLVEKRGSEGRHRLAREAVSPVAFLAPFHALRKAELVLDIVFSGAVFGVWTMIVSSTTRLFARDSALDSCPWALGLLFLPNGLGSMIGAVLTRRLMARDFRIAGVPARLVPSRLDGPGPTLESIRLRHLPWLLAMFVAAVMSYGWAVLPVRDRDLHISATASLAPPLALQFLVGLSGSALLAQGLALASDLSAPGHIGSVSALANLIRCAMAALGVAFIDTLLSWAGPGLGFAGLGLLVVASTPMMAMSWSWGPKWRAARAD